MINAKPVKKKTERDWSEARLEEWMREQVEKRGGLFVKLHPVSMRGLPDRMVIWRHPTHPASVDFIELKTVTGTLEPWQQRTIELMQNHYRCDVHIIYGYKEALAYFETIDSL